jgi:ubiquinone/menaquinone biosynthesis C-methylase UbiE
VNRSRWVAEQARKLKSGSAVLDAGAGTGLYRNYFSHCLYKAQDFAQEPSTLGKYAHLDYVSDITHIPADNDAFDAILCTEVLEHLPEPTAAIAEFARLLKPGGRLLLTAPLGSRIHQAPFYFCSGFSPYWYRHVLPRHGFSVESIEANYGFFSHVAQENRHLAYLIRPRIQTPTLQAAILTALWALVVLPLFILSLAAEYLDTLGLDASDTVGYHVVAVKHQR